MIPTKENKRLIILLRKLQAKENNDANAIAKTEYQLYGNKKDTLPSFKHEDRDDIQLLVDKGMIELATKPPISPIAQILNPSPGIDEYHLLPKGRAYLAQQTQDKFISGSHTSGMLAWSIWLDESINLVYRPKIRVLPNLIHSWIQTNLVTTTLSIDPPSHDEPLYRMRIPPFNTTYVVTRHHWQFDKGTKTWWKRRTQTTKKSHIGAEEVETFSELDDAMRYVAYYYPLLGIKRLNRMWKWARSFLRIVWKILNWWILPTIISLWVYDRYFNG